MKENEEKKIAGKRRKYVCDTLINPLQHTHVRTHLFFNFHRAAA